MSGRYRTIINNLTILITAIIRYFDAHDPDSRVILSHLVSFYILILYRFIVVRVVAITMILSNRPWLLEDIVDLLNILVSMRCLDTIKRGLGMVDFI